MLKIFTDLFSGISASARNDARVEARRICRRCAIAFELCGEETFRRLGARALAIRDSVADAAKCSDRQFKAVKKTLDELGGELAQLEIFHGLREKISDIHRTTPEKDV